MKWKIDRNHFVWSRWVHAFQIIINFSIFIKNFIISNAFILWVHNNINFSFMTYITYYINSKSNIEVVPMLFKWHGHICKSILIMYNACFNVFNIFKWCWFCKTHFSVLLNNTNNTFFSLFFNNTNFCKPYK